MRSACSSCSAVYSPFSFYPDCSRLVHIPKIRPILCSSCSHGKRSFFFGAVHRILMSLRLSIGHGHLNPANRLPSQTARLGLSTRLYASPSAEYIKPELIPRCSDTIQGQEETYTAVLRWYLVSGKSEASNRVLCSFMLFCALSHRAGYYFTFMGPSDIKAKQLAKTSMYLGVINTHHLS